MLEKCFLLGPCFGVLILKECVLSLFWTAFGIFWRRETGGGEKEFYFRSFRGIEEKPCAFHFLEHQFVTLSKFGGKGGGIERWLVNLATA